MRIHSLVTVNLSISRVNRTTIADGTVRALLQLVGWVCEERTTHILGGRAVGRGSETEWLADRRENKATEVFLEKRRLR